MAISWKRAGGVCACLVFGAAGAAQAHTGMGEAAGFAHGLSHPFSGLDHILAMVAVGLFAARKGGSALWVLPLSFMAMMAAGGFWGFAGGGLPLMEAGIALSIVALGAMIGLRADMPLAAAATLTGAFAVFHGFAHGAEAPPDASGYSYAAGFLVATGSLHLAGLGAGLGMGRLLRGASRGFDRAAGGALSALGLLFLSGSL